MRLSAKQWVLLTALISGIAVYYNSIAVKGIEPVGFAAAKNIIAAIVLAAFAFSASRLDEFRKLNLVQILQILAIALIGGSIPFALFFTGLSIVANGAVSSFIYRLVFAFSAIFAVIFLKERIGWKTGIGVGLILAANFAYLLNSANLSFGAGELLVLAATIMWSAENILLKKALEWISPDALAAARLGIGGMILIFGLIVFAPAKASAILSIPIFPLIASAFLIIGFAATYYRGLSGLAVSEATAILTLGGLVSAALPALINSKLPTSIEAISLLLIALGGWIVFMQAQKQKAKVGYWAE
jgi:drug/metabolite transporter (DMT)-like permease